MAKNKITHEWNEDGTAIIFTGSQRQPTLTEFHNYATDAIRKGTLPVMEGLYVTTVSADGFC